MKNILPELKIDFDEQNHLYIIDGEIYSSVTQIMRPMNTMLYQDIDPRVLHNAADRGTRAHEQISYYIRFGVLEVDSDTEPYIKAFQHFESIFKPTFVASEYRTYHAGLRYAGTVDIVGYIEPDDGTGVDVIDVKTTAKLYPVMLGTQVSAYAEAIKSHGVQIRKIYGLQLKNNGTWHLEQLDNRFPTFVHCLGIHNAMSEEILA